jgi:hypothetical protein
MNDRSRLAAIEARASAATPGPWTVCAYDKGETISEIGPVSSEKYTPDAWQPHYESTRLCVKQADAEFIAHARQDVPYLLAEVAALTAKLKTATEALTEAHTLMCDGTPAKAFTVIAAYQAGADEESKNV